MFVVIVSEFVELTRQVDHVLEKHGVEVLAPNSTDQPFDEWMRNWGVWNGLDPLDLEYPQVGEPAVESIQRVVVGADVLR